MTLRILTAGESHGPWLTAIMEGMVAGLHLTAEGIDRDLRRRQGGYGRSGRQVIEKDHVVFGGGVSGDTTTGGPIALQIENRDWKNWKDKTPPPMTIPRPGHADAAAATKYRYADLRLALERASARETAARVALGAIARRLLEHFGVIVTSQVISIGQAVTDCPADLSLSETRVRVDQSAVRTYSAEAEARMIEAIDVARRAKDTLGGVISIEAFNVPVGLGSHVHWDRKLDGRLAGAMMSIQAIKGVEIGDGFEGARARGSDFHDAIFAGSSAAAVRRETNRAGGLEGGITNGEPVVVRIAMKPISTLLRGMDSVDITTGKATRAEYQRSDICAVPAAGVVGEAMMCLILADAFLEKYGGDSLEEVEEHRRGRGRP